MKVKGNLVRAIAVGATLMCGAGLVGTVPAMAATKSATPTVSREVGKPLKAAQDALKKGDYTGALQQLDTADAMPKKSAALISTDREVNAAKPPKTGRAEYRIASSPGLVL